MQSHGECNLVFLVPLQNWEEHLEPAEHHTQAVHTGDSAGIQSDQVLERDSETQTVPQMDGSILHSCNDTHAIPGGMGIITAMEDTAIHLGHCLGLSAVVP